VPTAEYVRFASHYGFRPEFCEAVDPESKGIVENLVGYAKADLIVPQAPFGDFTAANIAAAAWCAEVNGAVHSEICAVPAERLMTERELLSGLPSLRASIGRQVTRKVDRLSCVRFASARYSVPVRLIGAQVRLRTDDGRLLVILTADGDVVAEHMLVAPGEASVRGPGPTLDYLASLEWIQAKENLCLVGPAGTGKSHVLVALGIAAVHAGHKVRYHTAADLTDALYRGLADNSVGRVIDTLLRHDLILIDEVGFAPLGETGSQLLFRFVSAAYERRSLGIASHWPFESWGRFLPEHTTAVSLLDRLLHHASVVVTSGDSYRMRQARAKGGITLNKP
jgi:IstB-like ATP binding protein